MIRDGAVNAEDNRSWLGGKIGSPNRPFDPLNSDFRSIDYLWHQTPLPKNYRSLRSPAAQVSRDSLAFQRLELKIPL